MKQESIEKIRQAIRNASPIIKEIEEKRKSKLIIFICHSSISHFTAYRLNKVIRKMGDIDHLDFLIESGGGDIDSATKITKTIRAYCKKLSVIVPFYAKSAASLMALAGDEIIMCKNGELGPIDPQVRDPTSDMWIPAHSIQEAIKFIEQTADPLVKLSLADKMPPLLIGAYRDSETASIQYLEEVLERLGDKKNEAIGLFTSKFLSHGYPIDFEQCKKGGLNIAKIDSELESKICDLHEIYEDIVLEFMSNEDLHDGILIIQANSHLCVVVGKEDITEQIKSQKKDKKPKSK